MRMHKELTFAGKRVWVTQPAPYGEMLCKKIRQAGGETFWLPVFEFQAENGFSDPLFFKNIFSAKPIQPDWMIFVSPRAVDFSFAFIEERGVKISSMVRMAAVGSGTARKLFALGFQEVIYPRHTPSSAALLALPVFKKMQDQKAVIVKGCGGLNVLAEELSARGAQVGEWNVYRRVLPAIASAATEKKEIEIFVKLQAGVIEASRMMRVEPVDHSTTASFA